MKIDEKNRKLIEAAGKSVEKIEEELNCFEQGFPFLKLECAASVGNGIMRPADSEVKNYIKIWDACLDEGKSTIVKFVPASGAASRMFKNLYEFLKADYSVPVTDFEKEFFGSIGDFAFYALLDGACAEKHGKGIRQLMDEGNYKAVVEMLLGENGLNYGALPKGLLAFHKYGKSFRTPLEEHLAEGAMYAADKNGNVNVHFTVSGEHRALFKSLAEKVLPAYEKEYKVKYAISFSEQKPATDTIAVDEDNRPFMDGDKILFRPGGHGALIENLNDMNADIVFIKNIDNVVPDSLKGDTVVYKKLIAGILVDFKRKADDCVRELEDGCPARSRLEEMLAFLEKDLCCKSSEAKGLDDAGLRDYLMRKLNRPMRVCGMVKNVGEPGGGPFFAYNPDGTVSLQILESLQIDMNDPEKCRMFKEGTHFNPVDLVCAIRDYKGNKFDLPEYVDKNTGFISSKSKDGRKLKALELPGLWNGAMSDWNTVFVEVPLSTFNPVKTVNDLLRPQHQN
jgi:hypothetical protein